MKALIVDDSAEDRIGLKSLLAHCPGIHTVNEATDLASARTFITTQAPDVVFLDVELGRENGFDLLNHNIPMPAVVFTTVHRHLGDKVFDVEAVDYLVKPVTEERLLRALRRVAAKLGRSTESVARIPIHRGGSERRFVVLDNVAAVAADGNYSIVYDDVHAHPDHRSLREWEKLLANHGFQRIDRSTLVDPTEVLALLPYGKGAKVNFKRSLQVLEIGFTARNRLEELLVGPNAES